MSAFHYVYVLRSFKDGNLYTGYTSDLKRRIEVHQLGRVQSTKGRLPVEFATAGMDQKLFISRYLVALPSAEKLRAFLEADRDQIESLMAPAPPKKRTRGKKSR